MASRLTFDHMAFDNDEGKMSADPLFQPINASVRGKFSCRNRSDADIDMGLVDK